MKGEPSLDYHATNFAKKKIKKGFSLYYQLKRKTLQTSKRYN